MSTKAPQADCDITKNLGHAEQQCQDNGARLTQKRKQILGILLQANKAISAYELIDHFYETHGERLPPTSIYRILDFLEGEHLVHKLKLANKYVACSHITCCEQHQATQFLICSRCNKVKEIVISPEAYSEIQKSSANAGFEIEQPQLEISCICAECR